MIKSNFNWIFVPNLSYDSTSLQQIGFNWIKYNKTIGIPLKIGQIQSKSLKNGLNQSKMSNLINFIDL